MFGNSTSGSDTSGTYDELVESLASLEEQLRDRAYDALRSASEGDESQLVEEKRISKARRHIVKAIDALS